MWILYVAVILLIILLFLYGINIIPGTALLASIPIVVSITSLILVYIGSQRDERREIVATQMDRMISLLNTFDMEMLPIWNSLQTGSVLETLTPQQELELLKVLKHIDVVITTSKGKVPITWQELLLTWSKRPLFQQVFRKYINLLGDTTKVYISNLIM